MKLKPEIRAEWVRRLRSGDYVQGKGRLALVADDGTTKACCLGVLCFMAVEDGVIPPPEVHELDHGMFDESACFHFEDDSTHIPPPKVVDWAFEEIPEIERSDFMGENVWRLEDRRTVEGGRVPDWDDIFQRPDEPWTTVHLSELNDNGATFTEIADWIEQDAQTDQ